MRPSPFALLALVAACSHAGDENLGMSTRGDATVDLSRLAAPDGLERALAVPASTVDKRLGAHRRKQSLQLTLQTGERKDAFEETWASAVDAQGAVHASHDNSRDYGIEWIATGGNLYVRLRHGHYAKRAAQGDEIERARDEQAGPLAGYLAVLGRFAGRQDGGQVTAVGRPARLVKLGLAERPSPLVEPIEPAHAWRKSLRVTALSGEVAFDTTSGAPLQARLDATYAFERGGKAITVTLAYRGAVSDLGAVSALAPPADVGPPLVRPRPLLERSALLDGLVPSVSAGEGR